METEIMGRVLTEAKIENLKDLWACERGLSGPEEARSITIPEALVDTGATLLSLPTRFIRQLGLKQDHKQACYQQCRADSGGHVRCRAADDSEIAPARSMFWKCPIACRSSLGKYRWNILTWSST